MNSFHIRFFEKDDGSKLPLCDEKYLFPFMSPTSNDTHYRDGPPEGDLTDRQRGRILLQVHQLLHLLQEYGINLKSKRMLDIGTGNGMIPRLVLELSDLESAVGADPYLDGELSVSWQVHDHDQAFQAFKSFLLKCCPDTLKYSVYGHLIEFENFSMIPQDVYLPAKRDKQYRFAKVGAHDLSLLDEKFDFVYAKAIEHISHWDEMFASIDSATNDGAILYFKHRTFFSYLGAHRSGSIGIPWGHLLLTDPEYQRCADEFYPKESDKMKAFYFDGLTYPRVTVPEMIRIAQRHKFHPVAVICEPTRYIDKVATFINEIAGFWNKISENHSLVGADEVLAGMYHIVLRKIT